MCPVAAMTKVLTAVCTISFSSTCFSCTHTSQILSKASSEAPATSKVSSDVYAMSSSSFDFEGTDAIKCGPQTLVSLRYFCKQKWKTNFKQLGKKLLHMRMSQTGLFYFGCLFAESLDDFDS